MFCKNCGGEIAEGIKFCKYCGTALTSAAAPSNPVQSNPTPAPAQNSNPNPYVYSNVQMNQQPQMSRPAQVSYGGDAAAQTQKMILMLVMSAITIFLALGGLMKTLVSDAGWSKQEASLKEVFDMLQIDELMELIDRGYGEEILEELFSTEQGFCILLFLVSCLFSLISLISGIIYVIKLISGSNGSSLARSARSVGRWQLTSIILLIVFMFLIKQATGSLAVKFSFWGWAVLILPLVNSFGVSNAYERACMATSADAYRMRERVCAQCNTYYSVGSRCPRCGSQAIR